ncbi:MAG: M4 family metallopeptidase, partial [Chloroflexi bacterium]|nr:M4 family metallopeptidase [Chloroflexota bacterium]
MYKFIRMLVLVLALVAVLGSMFSPTTATEPQHSTSSVAQGGSGLRAFNEQTGALNFINFAGQNGGRAANANEAMALANTYAGQFGLAAGSQVGLVGTTQSRSGSTYYRFQQTYNGIPVLAGEMKIAVGARGNVNAISGEFAQNLSNVATAPTISGAVASQTAAAYAARASGLSASAFTVSAPQLYYYDSSLISPRVEPITLVYQMDVMAPGQPYNYFVLIDSGRGGVRLAFNQIDTIMTDEDAERFAREIAENGSNDSVAHVDPGAPTIGSLLPNFNATGTTYNSNGTPDRQGVGASTLICTDTQPATVTLEGADSCEGGVTNATRANSAHFFAFQVHDYYDQLFGRDSIDDAGMNLISNVDFDPVPGPPLYSNAFWDGVQMTYGNGGYFTADDIVGHELTHGVTEHTSNLLYYYESGAINEAMSDIFGEMVDQLNGIQVDGTTGTVSPDSPGNRWLLGEDLGFVIRNMSDPPALGDPDRTRSPNYEITEFDGGGVHINSGVANKATFLMVDGGSFNSQTITALGPTAADSYILTANVWYEVEYLLTSGADFGVLNQALSAACTSLIGASLPGTSETLSAGDCTEVGEAALATEMHLEPGFDGFSPEVPVACNTPGTAPTPLYFNDFESGVSDFLFTDNVPAPSKTWYYNEPIIVPTGTFGFPYAARSGLYSLFGADFNGDRFGDPFGYLGTAELNVDVSLTGATEYYLHMWHLWGFDDFMGTMYDGLVIEYSTNGGSSWTDIDGLFDDGRSYDGTLPIMFGNPLGGRNAFGFNSNSYVNTQYDLSSLNGQDVRFRWMLGTDDSFEDQGYWLDDLLVYACTPIGNTPLAATANCVNEDLAVNITAGDGPFNITASAGVNTPVNGVSTGTTTIQGPEKWDNLTVTETGGDTQSLNLGQFKCRSTERPSPITPVHLSHTTNAFPTFSWTSITDANNYRVFVYDEKVPANRTVDIRQNSGGPTSMTLSTALPNARLFWRVRGRQNRIWSLWSVRFTLFKDPVIPVTSDSSGEDGSVISAPPPVSLPPVVDPSGSDGSAPPPAEAPTELPA